mmetsp:Transcript_12658/g.24723  ORF Transcript_12658/g.24723 Transcript_12658/m.24723 type:complete len:81 (+) Transcript_12658:518-760(+)
MAPRALLLPEAADLLAIRDVAPPVDEAPRERAGKIPVPGTLAVGSEPSIEGDMPLRRKTDSWNTGAIDPPASIGTGGVRV